MPNPTSCSITAILSNGDTIHESISEFPCTIGRCEDNGLVIPDVSISSHHAALVFSPDGVLSIEDRQSTNGMYLGIQKVQTLIIDKHLDLLLGKVRLTIDPLYPPQEKEIKPNLPLAMKQEGISGIICPHCWHRFEISDFLFIARHQSLVGDPILGPEAQQRFLPSKFTPEGNAIDAMGMSCPDMACPHCHLRIPRATKEMPPLFLSIVGATASGKTYFLTSMIWELRNLLSKDFALSFTDTDAVNNQMINDYEETVFLNPDQATPIALKKTELQGDLYNQIQLNDMLINLPCPFMFSISPAEHHPHFKDRAAELSRTLVLYDNAGEHFEPGMEQADNPTTQHLLHSDSFFFLFDPTKDVRFRKKITDSSDYQLSLMARSQRQEIILTEMINRIRKFSGLRSDTRVFKSLIIVVTKSDIWQKLLDIDLPEVPWEWNFDSNVCELDMEVLKNVSFSLRTLLEDTCPELVTTAESFSQNVIYLPNSALGHSPERNEQTGFIGIKPADVAPFWVAVPFLYYLWERGFISAKVSESARPALPAGHEYLEQLQYKRLGELFLVKIPGESQPIRVPLSYAGFRLHCPGTKYWFTIPEIEE